MSNSILIVTTAVRALGLQASSVDLPAGVQFIEVGDPQLRVVAEKDQAARFLLPSIRLETLAASMDSDLSGADANIYMARIEAQIRVEVAFFEQYVDRVLVVDLEAAAADPAATDDLLKARFGWPEGIGSLLEKAHIPPALDRLIWMEKKVSLGSSIQNLVWTLEACATPLGGSHALERVTSDNHLEGRRYQLATEVANAAASAPHDVERSLTAAEAQVAALKSEIDALKAAPAGDEVLERENADLRVELEKARLGQEISDLLVAQLQEELEMVLADELPNTSAEQAPAASNSNAEVIYSRTPEQPAPSVVTLSSKQKKTIKRFLLSAFMTPATRAKVRRIEGSGYFDADWYLDIYEDVQTSNMAPAHHYLRFGASEFRDPSPKFSTQRYLWQHPELNPARTNPLIHFLDSSK